MERYREISVYNITNTYLEFFLPCKKNFMYSIHIIVYSMLKWWIIMKIIARYFNVFGYKYMWWIYSYQMSFRKHSKILSAINIIGTLFNIKNSMRDLNLHNQLSMHWHMN